jgi:hypothetical protein
LASSVGSGPQLSAIIPHSSTDIHLGVCYHINDLGTGGHNLAYRKPHELELERQALYRSQFTNIINDAAREAKIVILFGYSLRIGEKRECFLHGTSFDLVEQPEHLRSSAFRVDRRKLAEIFGPHLQAIHLDEAPGYHQKRRRDVVCSRVPGSTASTSAVQRVDSSPSFGERD